MPKFRVTYTAAKSEHTYRQGKSGVQELLDSRVVFREEKSVMVEAPNGQLALEVVKRTLPPGCDFSGQVSQDSGRLY